MARLRRNAESSPAIVTALNPFIGYEAAAAVAHEALETGATIRDVVISRGHVASGEISQAQLDNALDVVAMARPQRSERIRTWRTLPCRRQILILLTGH